MAESILNWVSRGQAVVTSAGLAPLDDINPLAREAIRKLVNARIVRERPQSVACCEDDTFDYVVTLSREAQEGCPCLPGEPVRLHWRVEDPMATHGSRDQRQRAFDRLARDLVKRLEEWWRCRDTAQAVVENTLKRIRRPGQQARWRTRPSVDAPLLAVAYFGRMRSCMNMCALFERSGFQVVCGDKYGRAPELWPVMPHAVIVRVDGPRPILGVRPEFRTVEALRSALAKIPMLVVGDRIPSGEEQKILNNCAASYVHRPPQRDGHLVRALQELVSIRAT